MTASQTNVITQDGYKIDNYTRMPNIAFQDLKPNAFKLLAVYLDISGKGDVYAKNSTISERLGTSVNTMKSARKELADKGYILYAPGKDGKETTTAKITVQVAWMWEENHRRLSKSDTPETVSKSDSMVSNIDTPLSKSDTNKQDLYKQDLKEQEKDTPIVPKSNQDDKLAEMMVSVQKNLKQYGKHQKMAVAKSLLCLHEGDKAEMNLTRPISPAELVQFCVWWDKNHVKDGQVFTRPKNQGSVKSNIERWLDTIGKKIPARPGDNFFRRKLPTNIDMIDVIPDKAVG